MISRLAEKAVDAVSSKNSIGQDERELYIYGFFMLFSKLFFFLLTVIYGAILGLIGESMVFYIAFTCLREYAGGVHASTERVCTICTSLALLISVIAIKVCVSMPLIITPLVSIPLSIICIVLFSPLDTEEKRLTFNEKREYKIKTYISTALIITVGIAFLFIGEATYFYACVVSLILESVLLVVGKFSSHNSCIDSNS